MVGKIRGSVTKDGSEEIILYKLGSIHFYLFFNVLIFYWFKLV